MLRHKTVWQDVHGIVLLDKGLGYSSNQALQQVRRVYKAAKAGHTGTLDPLATGLLPICLGEASKFAQGLLDADKTYEARVCLGISTSTGDAEGEVLSQKPVKFTADDLAQVIQRFTGTIEQIPPMYSALKHQGRPLYEFARQGIDIVRQARVVTIYQLTVLRTSFTNEVDCLAGEAWIDIKAHVSKGTYIRTLGQDIGAQLGCGAHLSALRRSQLGPWQIEQAHTIESLQAMPASDLESALFPVDAMLEHLETVELSSEQSRLFSNGGRVRFLPLVLPLEQNQTLEVTAINELVQDVTPVVRVYTQGKFLGVAHSIQGVLHPIRLIQRAQ